MIDPESRDWFHLRQMLRMIALIDQRLDNFVRVGFLADRNEIDLTAFRLQVIGEAVRKLSSGVKDAHPHIAWASIVAMRNFIAHDYEGIEIERIWRVATDYLSPLSEVCRMELGKEGMRDL